MIQRITEKSKPKPSSVIALILVNLTPVFGVFFWGWDVFPIMLLFWSENVIIGLFNILKMMIVKPGKKESWLLKLFLIPFFIIHYGGFTAAHGMFVLVVFGQYVFENSAGPRLDTIWEIVQESNLLFAILALFLSHGYSMITNFIKKGEYRQITLSRLMMLPYGRVVLLHVSIVFGGLLMAFLQSPKVGLMLFIFIKIIMDLRAHLREHK